MLSPSCLFCSFTPPFPGEALLFAAWLTSVIFTRSKPKPPLCFLMRAQHLFAVSTAWTLVGFCIPGVLGSDLHKVCRRHPVAGASAPAQGEASLSASGGYASAPQTAAAPPPTEAAASSSAVPTGSAAVGSTGTARSASASSVASASDPVSTGSSGNGTSGGSSERMVFAHYMLVTPPLNE